jgi:hypothetical protein
MKEFAKYVERVDRARNISEFPQVKDHEYTVLILQPEGGTTEGIYRSLLPSLVLNRDTNIRCLPLGYSEHLESTSINEKAFEIKEKAAEIANHIVFPFVSQPLKPIMDWCREINPEIKFSYYIDFNYYYTPDSHPFANEYNKAEALEIIEDNILHVDQVIFTNHSLYSFLHAHLSEKPQFKGCGTELTFQEMYFDKTLIPEDMALIKNSGKKKRFGFVLNQRHFSDINYIKGVLKEFMKEHSAEAELVILGFNGIHKGKNYLKEINFEHHPTVPFFDYFEKLNELAIDCFVIPASPNKFNETSKNYIKYIEFSRLGVPVIAPNIKPYQKIISPNGNGVLCDKKETWTFQMETFLKDPDKFESMLTHSSATALDFDISDKQNMEKLMQVYEI